jgi:AcrR family transcriptional regulator
MNEPSCIPRSKLEPFNAPAQSRIDAWDLPRGQHGVAAETIQASQRARVLYAVVAAAAERGYANFTVADICRIAHVSRKTFYEQFSNRDDCFLTAYEVGQASLIRAIRAKSPAASSGPTEAIEWHAQLRASIRACLLFLRDNPELARMLLIEVRGASDRVWAVRDVGHKRFARLLRLLYQSRRTMPFDRPTATPPLSREFFPALISAVEGLLLPYVRARRVHQLMNAEPALQHLLLSMWAGNSAPAAMPETQVLVGFPAGGFPAGEHAIGRVGLWGENAAMPRSPLNAASLNKSGTSPCASLGPSTPILGQADIRSSAD